MVKPFVPRKSEGYTLSWVWKNLKENEELEVRNLWEKEGVLSPAAMDERVSQISMIVRDDASGEVAGVSTAYEQYNEQLESYFYYIRAFVGSGHRRHALAGNILIEVVNGFDSIYQENYYVIGVIIEVENDIIKQSLPFGTWKSSGLTYFGKNERGDHCRVRYFKNAPLFVPKPD